MSDADREHATSAAQEKMREEMRLKMRTLRESLTASEMADLSSKLAGHLSALLDHLAPSTAGFCWPWRGEFDARDLMAQWLAAAPGRRAALPVIEQEAAPMRFRQWSPGAAMTSGRFGIAIPAEGDWLAPDIFLMPVLAVDRAGFRLGYGGGYFDRTLAALKPRPLAVGVGFGFQEVDSILPQTWDERLDWVVTENGARKI